MARYNIWERIKGPQRRILAEALIESFDDEGELAVELKHRNVNYAAIRRGDTYQQRAANLVTWHVERGKVAHLVAFLQELRSDNPLVRELPAALDALDVIGAFTSGDAATAPTRELQRYIAQSPFSDLRLWLVRMAEISGRVCLVMAGAGTGTGFLVGRDLILTAGHVVDHIKETDTKGCLFDFARDANGTSPGRTVKFAEAWRIAFAPPDPTDERGIEHPSAENLDFALIKLAEVVADDDLSGKQRGFETPALDGENSHGAAFLIAQHPRQQPMQLSVGHSLGLTRGGLRLHYTASTLKGSSGSPVFDSKLRLVALHHAGDPEGLMATYNAGIPIGLVHRAAGLGALPW